LHFTVQGEEMHRRFFTVLLLSGFVCSTVGAALIAENFDESGGFFGTTGTGGVPSSPVVSGWVVKNQSTVAGDNSWRSGSAALLFPPHSGTGYAAVDSDSTVDMNDISNWLITPTVSFNAGDTLSFYARTAAPVQFADRLEVRLSTNGSSTNVGVGATGIGDFTTLLTSINPNLTLVGFPTTWTQYTVTMPASGTGRVAFRYNVTNGGPAGDNSNFIGIDSMELVPEPMALGTLALAALALHRGQRRQQQ
jgi:hypothetical protein